MHHSIIQRLMHELGCDASMARVAVADFKTRSA